MKKRKWLFVIVIALFTILVVSYETYPKWIIINKDKKISQMPSKWKNLIIGARREKILQFLDGSFDERTLWWPDKPDLWLKQDGHGWYQLTVFYNSDSLVTYYSIEYYFGSQENYKFSRLMEFGSL